MTSTSSMSDGGFQGHLNAGISDTKKTLRFKNTEWFAI